MLYIYFIFLISIYNFSKCNIRSHKHLTYHDKYEYIYANIIPVLLNVFILNPILIVLYNYFKTNYQYNTLSDTTNFFLFYFTDIIIYKYNHHYMQLYTTGTMFIPLLLSYLFSMNELLLIPYFYCFNNLVFFI